MHKTAIYDEDIHAWAEQQADALRRLAATRRDLPNELDLEHVAEEIEDLGRSELRMVESFIQQILIHLLKAASVDDDRLYRVWGREIEAFRIDLIKNLTRSMRRKIDMDEGWTLARLRAEAALDAQGDSLAADLPPSCPLSLDDLTAATFDVDAAVQAIRGGSVA